MKISEYGLLTKCEEKTLLLIAEGHTNMQIADRLFISIRTAEWHRANIIKKLKLSGASQLAIAAYKYKLLIKANKE